MTRHSLRGLAVIAFVAPLAAQQPGLAPEHALLKEMAGTWKVTATGPATSDGRTLMSMAEQVETAELVCGGSWLESVIRSGKSEVYRLTGFDPEQRRFVRVCVAGKEEPVVEDGEFDAERRTITWRRRSVAARQPGVQTVVALRQGEPRIERLVLVRANGQETFPGEWTFVRADADARAVPKRDQPKAPTPEHVLLARLAGDWDCAITATMPGLEKPLRSAGRMREEVLSDGCWLRSSFESEFGGSKIEGRGLMGFDPKKKRYVRFWADSGSPVLAISTSSIDETGKKLVGTGATQMPGGEVTIAEEVELGADQRHVVQRLTSADGKDAGTFEMVMTRRAPAKAK